jgi:hypothetical protein
VGESAADKAADVTVGDALTSMSMNIQHGRAANIAFSNVLSKLGSPMVSLQEHRGPPIIDGLRNVGAVKAKLESR